MSRHANRLIPTVALLLVCLVAPHSVSAAPRTIFAIASGLPSGVPDTPLNPSDSVLFFDVTDVGAGGAANVLNNEPLFSVWMGYEIFQGELNDQPQGLPFGNREEMSAITVNPANGTVYVAAFDSGAPAAVNPANGQLFLNPDQVGDNQGDFDLYRIDYQTILADFVNNSRAKGTIYAPKTLNITNSDETFLQSIASPLFDGVVDGLANNVPHPSGGPTVHLDGVFSKIGELGRAQGGTKPSSYSFFNPNGFFDIELDFIDPETLVVMDDATDQTAAGDFQIRAWQRVSTSPGAAMISPNGPDGIAGSSGQPAAADDDQGGYNGNSTQSWESTILARLGLDADSDNSISEPVGWALVNRDGKLGIWVADDDGAETIGIDGDDISFFELDFSGATPTATKKNLAGAAIPTSLQFDDDPSVGTATNDGNIDFLAVDRNGNLIVSESNFFASAESKVVTVGIEDYDADGQVAPAGWAASGNVDGFDSPGPYSTSAVLPISGGIDDDADVTDTRRVAYDKSSGYVYIIDRDDDFVEDLYVFDPTTGTVVYSEVNGFNPGLFNTGTQVVFTRGDINGDGVADAGDLAALTAAISDPTQGGRYSGPVGQEFYDLTGDRLLTNDDLLELQSIIGAASPAGDYNSDGVVDAADYTVWRDNLGNPAGLPNSGGLTGAVDSSYYDLWKTNFGQPSPAALAADSPQGVPEPSSWLLIAVGLVACEARRRR